MVHIENGSLYCTQKVLRMEGERLGVAVKRVHSHFMHHMGFEFTGTLANIRKLMKAHVSWSL
jgi:hypothetical protein